MARPPAPGPFPRVADVLIVAPTPPPKPPAPPLEKLVRLAGILDFGSSVPPEAIIEILAKRETRNFKVGDTLTPVPATVKEITGGVVVAYDEKLWKLTYESIRELPSAPGTTSEDKQ